MKTNLIAFVAGLLFAVGLALGGMLHPAKIIGFLDVLGRWDPSLAFVMGGAVVVAFVFTRLALGRPHPYFAASFRMPTATAVDAPLVIGSALFGIGWGMAGYCPGPAIVSLASGAGEVLLFLVAMAASATAVRVWRANRA